MRKPVLIAAVCAGLASPALAEVKTFDLGPDVELDPYGFLHGAWQVFEDGAARTGTVVDPSTSIGRLGFYIRSKTRDDGLSFQFESSWGFRPSTHTSQINTPEGFDWTRRNLRQVQLIWTSSIGTIRAGQGSMPLDSAAETDPGGYNDVAKSNLTEGYGDYILRDGSGALSPLTIKDTFDSFDGDRRLRLRYDTPSFAGFSLAVAYGMEVLKSEVDSRYYGAALRYKQSFGDVDVSAAAGTTWENDDSAVTHASVGSISAMHRPSGVNATLAAGRFSEDSEPGYLYLRAGWNRAIFPIGESKIAVEYFRGQDYDTRGSESVMWGIALLQEIEDWNTLLYAGYREFDYDAPGAVTYQGAKGIQIGAKWTF